MAKICSLWSSESSTWASANWLWPSCKEVPETNPTFPGIDASLIARELEEPWDAYKELKEKRRKKMVNLICKVRGEQQYSEEKEIKDLQLKVGDVKVIVKAPTVIDLNFKV